MTRGKGEGDGRARGFGAAVERFNERLRPYLGAPPLGPYTDDPVPEP